MKDLVLKIFLVGVKTYNTAFSKNTAFLNILTLIFLMAVLNPVAF